MDDSKRADIDAGFKNRAINYMPRWAWACCAILMALSIAIRQVGLDVTTPLNRIMTAYAVRIENSALGRNEESLLELKRINDRLERLEAVAHKP
ncbi:hypothetical protein ACJJIF_07275 [Microbulbifer sp. SSSA002]|uniref:hypothetical protein n=1 Tax=unclassified Microbulbifer TaxID=2619833 RepID=UPI0040399E0F